MRGSAPCEKIIATLRQQLKTKGRSYRDVASHLGVSEGTIKRYLAGKGVTIEILQRLAEVVDLDLLSLAALAQQEGAYTTEWTRAQQDALAKDQAVLATYFFLLRGWSPAQIAREFELSPEKLERALDRLQALGVIRRLSARGVQILVHPSYEKRAVGPLAGRGVEMGSQFLREVNLRDPKCEWTSNAARLSPASVQHMQEMIKAFVSEFLSLSEKDRNMAPEQVQWYHLFVGAKPVSRKKILRLG